MCTHPHATNTVLNTQHSHTHPCTHTHTQGSACPPICKESFLCLSWNTTQEPRPLHPVVPHYRSTKGGGAGEGRLHQHLVPWYTPTACLRQCSYYLVVSYAGMTDREQAVRVLEAKPVGSYLVRLSTKIWGYTVSVKGTYTLAAWNEF